MNRKLKKGMAFEAKYSETFHEKGIPVLASMATLRRYGVGQVDMVRAIEKRGEWRLEMVELKSGQLKPELSKRQGKRLREAAQFLGAALDMSVEFRGDIDGGKKKGCAKERPCF